MSMIYGATSTSTYLVAPVHELRILNSTEQDLSTRLRLSVDQIGPHQYGITCSFRHYYPYIVGTQRYKVLVLIIASGSPSCCRRRWEHDVPASEDRRVAAGAAAPSRPTATGDWTSIQIPSSTFLVSLMNSSHLHQLIPHAVHHHLHGSSQCPGSTNNSPHSLPSLETCEFINIELLTYAAHA